MLYVLCCLLQFWCTDIKCLVFSIQKKVGSVIIVEGFTFAELLNGKMLGSRNLDIFKENSEHVWLNFQS